MRPQCRPWCPPQRGTGLADPTSTTVLSLEFKGHPAKGVWICRSKCSVAHHGFFLVGGTLWRPQP